MLNGDREAQPGAKEMGANTQSPGSRQKRWQLSTQHIAEGEK